MKKKTLATEVLSDCLAEMTQQAEALNDLESKLLDLMRVIQKQRHHILKYLGSDNVKTVPQMSDERWNQLAYQNYLERSRMNGSEKTTKSSDDTGGEESGCGAV